MTNKEIKLELAKVALTRCNYTDADVFTVAMHNLYEWIVAEDVEVKEETPIQTLLGMITGQRHRGGFYANKLEGIFSVNNIKSVEDLVRFGKINFSRLDNVGRGSISRIDDALEELCGTTNW